MRENFFPSLQKHVGAARERKGISKGPGQVQATDIAKTLPNAEGNTAPAHDDRLPPLISAASITRESITRNKPPLLVEHILHRGCKMVLAGGSKTYKSWALIDLGLSLAAGVPWWEKACAKDCVVLYLNFELIPAFFEERILDVVEAKKIKLPPWFLYWNLRHKCYDLKQLAIILRQRLADFNGRVDVIIVDPIYKAYGGLDENSATEMSDLMYTVEDLSDETNAAIIFGAHFSKGAQAQKEAKDRISGSGVFGRDPDAILTMTRHREDWHYSVETDLRYCKPLDDFVINWEAPLFQIAEGKDPRDLWVPGKKGETEEKESPFTDKDVLAALVHSGMQDSMWREQVRKKFGKAGNAYYTIKKQLMDAGLVKKHGLKYVPTGFKLDGQQASQ